jgi:hypothetical protein
MKTRLTPEDIEATIADVKYHRLPDSTTTICQMTLRNGYTIVGQSACIDPSLFSEEIGNAIAYNNAIEQIWRLEGYLLKERLFLAEQESN